nr:AAA family ATPase [uncultured Rhodopila sp.]
MRLTALTLNKYGCFEDERIVFDPRPGVLNLLIAPNGAGKSVLRTAFGDLLFGIHNQTPMGFRFGYPGMRIAADILRSDGSTLTIGRRKARGNALTAADGGELDPSVAGALLGTRDRPLLERLFALDTDRLREGGKALLASGGDLASALLSASGGIREARQLLRALEKERDDLAPARRASQRPYYRALDSYTDARRRIAAAQLKPDERQAQQDRLDELLRQQHEHNRRAEAASAEISRLERIRRVRPLLAQRDEAASWLEANPDAPNLAPGLRQRLGEAHLALVKAETEANNKAQALTEVEAQAAAIVLDTALLAEAAAIDSLTAETGAARKAAADRPGIVGELEAKSARIGDLLRQLGSDLPPARAAEAIPQRTLQARTQRLIRDHTEQMAATRDAPAKHAARTRDLAEIDRKLAALPAAQDLHGLDALVREIGDPAARRGEAERAHAETAATLAATLARVPGWHGDANTLAETKPLTEDLYKRHDLDVQIATTEETRARDLHAAEDGKLQVARTQLDETARSGSVPDVEALQRARGRREAVWRLIYRHAFTADKPSSEEEKAVTDGTPLPLAFERAMAAADTLADQRTEQSDLLARIDAAKRSMESQETLVSQAADRLRVAQQKADAARRAWMQICAPLPLGVTATLSDVTAFVAARERVLDAMARHAVATRGLEALAAKHAAWAARLAQALPPPHDDLAALLSRARQAADDGSKREKAAERLETQRAQAAKELRETEAAATEAHQRLESWRTDWQALLTELRRPPGEDPAVTEQVLHLLNDIDKEHQAAATLSRRISGMQADIDRFGQSVRDVAARIAGTDPAADAFGTTRDLSRRLAGQKELREKQNLLIVQRDAARLAAETASAALADSRAALNAILLQVGVDTIEAAQAHLTLAEQRSRFEAQCNDADAKLHDAGDAVSVGRLRDEIADIPPDELQGRHDALVEDRRAAGAAAQAALKDLTELRVGMAQQDADTNVNTAAADRQAAVAAVANTLDESLLLHAAASMLDLALKSLEETGDSGLLLRIGSIFQALTLGAYARVTSETDGDSAARLVLVQRAFPEERQTVDQLSEGTRDQLFLALRVAEIERHLTGATPLPFIGDDILQTFDDDRALAAMEVLTDLSHRTQTILLTHHRHVVDLSAQLPAGSVHICEREAALSVG